MLFHQELKEKRLYYHVSQKKLAVMSGHTREYINKIETGKYNPSDEMKSALLETLERLNPHQPLELMFDYVRLRFESHDVKYLIEQVMRIKMKYLLFEEYAFYGYTAKYVFSQIQVMVSPQEDKRGTLLELKGQGCREFEAILLSQGRTWFDFFLACEKEKVQYKRIDLAINDKTGLLDIEYLIEKCERKECRSKFRSFQGLGSGELSTQEKAEGIGSTLYLGSMRSDIYFCLYEKDYEQYVKRGIPIEEAPVKNRFELRLKNDRAYHAIQDLLIYRDCERTVFHIIQNYLTFLTPHPVKQKKDWSLDPMWTHFIGNKRGTLCLTTEPEPVSLQRTMKWLRKQVAPSLKMLLEIDERNQTTKIREMIEDALLQEKHETIIEQQTLPLEELIL